MTIAERIKQARQTLSMTQAKFAERIAISTGHLAGMELGTKRVYDRTIRFICMEFGVDEHWLRTGAGSMFNDEASAEVSRVSSLYKSLFPYFRECAMKQLDELAKLYKALDK